MGGQDPSRVPPFPWSGRNSFSASCPGMVGYEPTARPWLTGIVQGANGSPRPRQSSQRTQESYGGLSKEPPKVRACLAFCCCCCFF